MNQPQVREDLEVGITETPTKEDEEAVLKLITKALNSLGYDLFVINAAKKEDLINSTGTRLSAGRADIAYLLLIIQDILLGQLNLSTQLVDSIMKGIMQLKGGD